MKRVKAWDKTFIPHIDNNTIINSVKICAERINEKYSDATDETAPIFISILNGAFMYTSDLLKEITIPCELSFVKVSSYSGCSSDGVVKELIGLNRDITGRDVVVIDDIIDSGLTMIDVKRQLQGMNPKSISVTAFLYKINACTKDLHVDFPCITMEKNDFVIGYGLDYNGIGRNYPEVFILEE